MAPWPASNRPEELSHGEAEGGLKGSRSGNAEQREAHWRTVLAEWEKSGLTQTTFCREHG